MMACTACGADISTPHRLLYCEEPGVPGLFVRGELRDYTLAHYWQDTRRPYCTVCVQTKMLTFFVACACGPDAYRESVPPAVASRLSRWFETPEDASAG